MLFRSLVAATAALPATYAQFVTPPTDLKTAKGHAGVDVRYKQVPNGICELDPKVKSFSGYADIGPDQHIFFWFFEAREVDPHEAPLTVWVNGGPGSSSMLGLFQELGPCGVDISGKVYNNPNSWTQKSNMIFIDQPNTVGFSYSDHLVQAWLDKQKGGVHLLKDGKCPEDHLDTCGTFSSANSTVPKSTPEAATGMWKTLQGFTGAFPQYSKGGFHFASESYGGHYGPIFVDHIEKQNEKNISGARKIDFKSLLLGNAWVDPYIQFQAYYNYTVSPGNTYDVHPYNASTEQALHDNLYGSGKCLDLIRECNASGTDEQCKKANDFCTNDVINVFYGTGRDEFDIREMVPDRFPYPFYALYLNKPEVQEAVGAFVNFSYASGTINSAFSASGDVARQFGIVDIIRGLLAKGIQVATYTGDADYKCNWLGSERVAEEINAPGFVDGAGYANVCTHDGIVHGQTKQAGLFSFTRIFESGHEVPFYQPVIALSLFNRVISGKDIETGKEAVHSNYRSKGSKRSTYREGGRTVQTHVLPINATYNHKTNMPDSS